MSLYKKASFLVTKLVSVISSVIVLFLSQLYGRNKNERIITKINRERRPLFSAVHTF